MGVNGSMVSAASVLTVVPAPARRPPARPLDHAAARARRRHRGRAAARRSTTSAFRGRSSRAPATPPPRVRARQRERLPTALVTTPESLSLLLTARRRARALRAICALVVVDEWHELMGTKRGVQTELALARLRRFRPALRTWGLSATIGNLDDARDALLGVGADGTPRRPDRARRRAEGRSSSTRSSRRTIERFPWAGHLGTQLLPQVVAAIEEGESAIVFTNTRSQTEIWYQAILAARPDWAGDDRAASRLARPRSSASGSRTGCATGSLRCVVCTSTPRPRRRLLAGGPRAAGRQPEGRRPAAAARRAQRPPARRGEPRDLRADERARADRGRGRARRRWRRGAIEARLPVERPLDVLAQHVVTVALGGGFRADELLRRGADHLRLPRAHATTSGAGCSTSSPAAARRCAPIPSTRRRRWSRTVSSVDEPRGRAPAPDVDRHDRQRRGDRRAVLRGGSARLGRGDRSSPGSGRATASSSPARRSSSCAVRDMKAWVRRAPNAQGRDSRAGWERGMPLSAELARRGPRASSTRRGRASSWARRWRRCARSWSCSALVARSRPRTSCSIERVKTREGHHSSSIRSRAGWCTRGWRRCSPTGWRGSRRSLHAGVERLRVRAAARRPGAARRGARGRAALAVAPAATTSRPASTRPRWRKRQFREIARVAGLVFPGFPRRQDRAKQLQASSGCSSTCSPRYDPGQPAADAGAPRGAGAAARAEPARPRAGPARRGRITVVEVERPTPLAFPLLVDRAREQLTSEKLATGSSG